MRLVAGLAVVLTAVVLSSRSRPIDTVYAPELFGRAHLSGNVISNSWVSFRMTGGASGYLEQIGGPAVNDRSAENGGDFPAGRIPYRISIHGSEFQGWIYFRGHARPFCGGAGYVPKKCSLK